MEIKDAIIRREAANLDTGITWVRAPSCESADSTRQNDGGAESQRPQAGDLDRRVWIKDEAGDENEKEVGVEAFFGHL